ncbi:MAG: hypothetical protein FWG63_01745 [Defluviitaleaceae bacterium]|nr:hypothetical protein [Defluviitaleaceae bacterium]
MLFKLLKYDLMYSKNKFLSMAGILVAYALIFGFSVPFIQDLIFANISAMVLFGLISMVITKLSIIFVYQNYAKNLFSDHGYLMFTLPVKPYLLLVTKIFSALIWLNFMTLVSAVAFVVAFFGQHGPFFALSDAIDFLLDGTHVWLFIHMNAIGFFVISLFFAIITLGHSAVKSRVVHSIVAVVLGITYFILWSEAQGWYIRTFGWATQNQPLTVRIGNFDYNMFLLGSSIVFGLVACLAIIKLYKRMELR